MSVITDNYVDDRNDCPCRYMNQCTSCNFRYDKFDLSDYMEDINDKEKDRKMIKLLKKTAKSGNFRTKLAVRRAIKRLEI